MRWFSERVAAARKAHGRKAKAHGLAATIVALGTACGGEAAVVEVRADDLSIPQELSSFCLAVADTDAEGGEFARVYQFDDELTELPQTLTIDPGDASAAVASARGYRSGIEVARATAPLGFDGGEAAVLSLSRCPLGAPAAAGVAATADASGMDRVAASFGRGGSLVVGAGADASVAFRVAPDGLTPEQLTPLGPSAPVSSLLAFDADGDCDDDVLVGSEGAGAQLWRRGPTGEFVLATDAFAAGAPLVRAAASADVDGDGDIDLVVGDATTLELWRNDGAGRFAPAPGALATDATSDITALAFGDLDRDGAVDLVVARGREAPAPVRLLLGQADGALVQVDAAAPATALSVSELVIRDLDGDRVDDVVIAIAGGPMRVFAGRGDGRLEDRSFLYFPDGAPDDANAVAVADWDGDCLADTLVGSSTGVVGFRGSEVGFTGDALPAVSSGRSTVFADLDDDGDFDGLVLDDAGGLTWLRR